MGNLIEFAAELILPSKGNYLNQPLGDPWRAALRLRDAEAAGLQDGSDILQRCLLDHDDGCDLRSREVDTPAEAETRSVDAIGEGTRSAERDPETLDRPIENLR